MFMPFPRHENEVNLEWCQQVNEMQNTFVATLEDYGTHMKLFHTQTFVLN